MKVGLIRCLLTEDIVSGTNLLKAINTTKITVAVAEESMEIIELNTCGGCTGRKAVARAVDMVKKGVDTIALVSCISKGVQIGFPCPNIDQMRTELLQELLNQSVPPATLLYIGLNQDMEDEKNVVFRVFGRAETDIK
jgi:Predicted metal-binding protein